MKNPHPVDCPCKKGYQEEILKQIGQVEINHINYSDSSFTTRYVCKKCGTKWQRVVIGDYHHAKEDNWLKVE